MTATVPKTDVRALKARHRAMWALGDYPAVAIDVIPQLGPELVAASGVRAGGPCAGRGRGPRERRGTCRKDRAPGWSSPT